jgi:hypothetical protein
MILNKHNNIRGVYIMKKFTTLLLISIFLLFNTITSAFAANVFKEGVYKISNFNFSPNNIYNIQNISPNGGVFVAIFDENQVVLQTIKLGPKSDKYNLIPLSPKDRIMIVGNGEVFID